MEYRIVIFDNNEYENAVFGKSEWMTKEEYDKAIEELKKPSMFGNDNFTITTETRNTICIEDCLCGTCKHKGTCWCCDCDICENCDCNCVYCNEYEGE